MPQHCPVRNNVVTVTLLKSIEFPTVTTDIAYTGKPSIKLYIVYGISVFVSHTADYQLITRAGTNLMHSEILSSWSYRIEHENVPKWCTVAKQPLISDTWILNICLNKLNSHNWFDESPHFVFIILVDTSFSDRFILWNFLIQHKMVPSHSRFNEFEHIKSSHGVPEANSVSKYLDKAIDQNVWNKTANNIVYVAQKFLLHPNT